MTYISQSQLKLARHHIKLAIPSSIHAKPRPVDKGTPEVDRLKKTIGVAAPNAVDDIYADRWWEAAGNQTAMTLPQGVRIGSNIVGHALPWYGKGIAAAVGTGGRLYSNTHNAINQTAANSFLTNEDVARDVNGIVDRDVSRGLFNSAQGWLGPKSLTSEQLFYANAAKRYAQSVARTVKDSPHAFAPELGTTQGQIASTALAASSYNPYGFVGNLAYSGLQGTRALNTLKGVNDAREQLKNDTFAPNDPGAWQYFGDGVTATNNENFIASLPAAEMPAYLRQRDKNNGIVARIGDKPDPNAFFQLKGDPVYRVKTQTPQNTPYGRRINPKRKSQSFLTTEPSELRRTVQGVKDYGNNLGQELLNNYGLRRGGGNSEPAPTVRQNPDYQQIRMSYPSFANK
jgi:hypothetical protein